MTGVNQVQVNVRAGLNFANGLRSILRQDPDIILIGEIRDGETARLPSAPRHGPPGAQPHPHQ